MFLGRYHFAGDTDALAAAYDRLMAVVSRDDVQIQICVRVPGGLDIYDACPDREEFRRFSTQAAFVAAIERAGLPRPRVDELGDIHRSIAGLSVVRD